MPTPPRYLARVVRNSGPLRHSRNLVVPEHLGHIVADTGFPRRLGNTSGLAPVRTETRVVPPGYPFRVVTTPSPQAVYGRDGERRDGDPEAAHLTVGKAQDSRLVRDCQMRSANRRHDVPLLSKYTTAATARAVLGNCTLRWSSPKLFNDPFDVPREMDLGFTFDDFRQAVVDRVGAYLEGDAVPGSEAGLSLLTALKSRREVRRSVLLEDLWGTLAMAAVPSLVSMEQLRAAWHARVPGLRILCFSEVADSPAMWAHYADDHRGVVLQFESNDERDSCWLLARPVRYRVERPRLPTVDAWVRAFLGEEEIDWDEYLHDYYYVKAQEWVYEREYRCVSDKKMHEEGLYSDYVFHKEDLRGVVLGAHIPVADERAIRVLANLYPNAVVYRARIDQSIRRISYAPARE